MTSAVQASYSFPDGTEITVVVQVPESYPDALNQARLEAVRGIEQLIGRDEPAVDSVFDEGDED